MKLWWKKGILNTVEHAVTRGADALVTILLIRALDAATFSRVALAQAWLAPVLLIFISPETILYRDYSEWKVQGRLFLQLRLSAFRRFALLKWGMATLIALGVAALSKAPSFEEKYWIFCAWLWAAWLPLVPQILGPDREFLRMSLRLRALNVLTLIQKLSLLGGVVAVLAIFPSDLVLPGIGTVLWFSVSVSWVLGWWTARGELKKLEELPQTRDILPTLRGWRAVYDSLRGFSFWSHLSGVVQNWVQTMDLFFLGIFHASSVAQLALYAVALKLSNLLLALPLALANIFGVWVGSTQTAQRDRVKSLTMRLYLACIAQMLVFWMFSSWIINWLSRGRWSAADQDQIFHWLVLISTATMMYASTFLMSSWITLRKNVRKLFFWVYVPWLVISMGVYAGAAKKWTFTEVAAANLVIAIVFIALLWRQWSRAEESAE